VALYLVVERALIVTGNPNYVPSLLLLGAFTAPVAGVAFIYGRPAQWTVTMPWIAGAFLFGGVIGTVIAGNLEYRTRVDLGTLPTIAIGLSEESAKLLVPFVIFFLLRRSTTPVDGVVLGVASGMGFAALETMGYGFVALLETKGDLASVDLLLLFRGLVAPAGHASWTGATAATLYLAMTTMRARDWARFVGVFLLVVTLHALWDGLNSWWAYVVIGLVSIGLLWHEFRLAARRTAAATARVIDQGLRPSAG
jgi:RsiW-degrading membrane proteinase PrsW (M82 family)